MEMFGGSGDRAENGPDERTLALAVDPGMEMVGDRCVGETGLLGSARECHQIGRRMFFAG
jgi:hypothetical protein